jgi:hypothetical protein
VHEVDDRLSTAEAVERGAAVAAAGGSPELAARLAGAAAALRDELGAPRLPPEEAYLDRLLEPARAALGEAFAAAAAEGRRLDLQAAVDLAASGVGAPA